MTRATACALLCAMALLAGCRLDADLDVAVDGEGGGIFAVTVAADDELLAAATAPAVGDARAVDPLAALEQAAGALDGWEVARSDASDGGDTGGAASATMHSSRAAADGPAPATMITLTTRFSDPAELTRATDAFADGLASAELVPLEPFTLALTDDTVALAGAAALRPTEQVSELALTPAQAEQRLADTVRMRAVARMPGRILRTNADERPDDTTAVWVIAAGQRRVMEVVSTRPWSFARVVALLGGPWAAAAAVLTLAATAGMAAWLLVRRRQASR